MTKMGDAYAEHAPERLVNPAVAWGTLGAHVVTAKSDRGVWAARRSFTNNLELPKFLNKSLHKPPFNFGPTLFV